MQIKLLLYGTQFCHLCEQAESILHAAQLTTEYIDIAEDTMLLEKYGMRIPVIQRVDNGTELDWPFDTSALEHFMA